MIIRLSFCQNSKNAYYIGTIRISFIQELIEQKRLFINICTGPALDMPSGRKEVIVTLANAQNDQIKKYGKFPAKESENYHVINSVYI